MGARGPAEHPMRHKLMAAIRAGRLTIIEASWVAAISRQRVQQWCAAERLNVEACRAAYLKKLWARALRRERMRSKGITPRRKSKAELRDQGQRAVAQFRKRKRC